VDTSVELNCHDSFVDVCHGPLSFAVFVFGVYCMLL